VSAKQRQGKTRESGDLRFETRNVAALGAALVCIVFGFFFLSRGSITLAPVLLVLGYCVLIPYGLAAGRGRRGGPAGE
jgi:hypothetical protein